MMLSTGCRDGPVLPSHLDIWQPSWHSVPPDFGPQGLPCLPPQVWCCQTKKLGLAASYHTSKAMQRCLKQKLGSKGLWPKLFWPPFSPDLNPLDYHLWMHVAERACATSHPNVDALKASVDQEWAAKWDTDLIEAIKDFWHLRYNISWIVLAWNAPKTHFHILTTSSTVSTRCSQSICTLGVCRKTWRPDFDWQANLALYPGWVGYTTMLSKVLSKLFLKKSHADVCMTSELLGTVCQ